MAEQLSNKGNNRRISSRGQTIGITIDSFAEYEAGLEYRRLRARREVPALAEQEKEASPLKHLLVTGRYRSRKGERKVGRLRKTGN